MDCGKQNIESLLLCRLGSFNVNNIVDVTEIKLDYLLWLFVLSVVHTHPSAMFVGQSEAVTLTTPHCLPRHTSTTSGLMTESIWDLHLAYHKEKV